MKNILDKLFESYQRMLTEEQMEFDLGNTYSRKPPVATIDYKDLDSAKYPMFKIDQPAIGAYAQRNPENFAKLITFVLCSIQTEWPRLNAWFPIFWEYLSKNNGKIDWDTKDPTLNPIVKWFGRAKNAISFIWNYRKQVYTDVMRAVSADEKNGDTGFLVYRKLILVPGLGVPKAGFATQLLTGKVGCIDSVNLNILGAEVPDDIITKDKTFKPGGEISVPDSGGQRFRSRFKELMDRMKGDKDKENLVKLLYGHPNEVSARVQEGYMNFLKDLESKGVSSQVLWDVWCEVIANKIDHFGAKPLDVVLPNQAEPARLKSYKSSRADHLATTKERMDNWTKQNPGSNRGQRISRDHADLITNESRLSEGRVNNSTVDKISKLMAKAFYDNNQEMPEDLTTSELWKLWHYIHEETAYDDSHPRFRDRERLFPHDHSFSLYPDNSNDDTMTWGLQRAYKKAVALYRHWKRLDAHSELPVNESKFLRMMSEGWGSEEDGGIANASPCPMCDGEGTPMGSLGKSEHFRCRACGWEWSEDTGSSFEP